jgi:transcriptional regulator with XRE-family HTH domain
MRSQHSPIYRAFTRRLRKARLERGLTQEQVAKSLGIPESRVSRMETGERRVDVIELAAFAKLYRKTLNYFVPGV